MTVSPTSTFVTPEPTSWIRADVRDLGLVQAAGVAETGLLCSASDHHIFGKLRWTRREAFTRYLELVNAVIAAGTDSVVSSQSRLPSSRSIRQATNSRAGAVASTPALTGSVSVSPTATTSFGSGVAS